MTTPTLYTPLECLLLFQSLVAYGTEVKSFVRISDLITNNAIVKDGETYDPARLNSDSLQELFLQLLRDELKSEQDGQQDGSQNTSKKRKIQAPALPTIKDAQEYKEKLPLLVDRLYARYSEHVVRGIREDEQDYADLDREIAELERLEAEEVTLKESSALANKNGNILPVEPLPKTNGTGPVVQPNEKEIGNEKEVEVPIPTLPTEPLSAKVSSPPLSASQPEQISEVLAVNDVLNTQSTPAPSSPKVDQRPPNGTSNSPPPNQQIPASIGPHGPSPLQPPLQSPLQPPQQQQQQQPGMAYKWEPPYQASPPQYPQYQQGPQYPPPYNPQYPPQGYAPPPRGTFSSPQGVPPHLQVPSSPHNGQHPVLLPPSNGGHRSPSSPGMPTLDALADIAGQQYRAPSGSPMPQQGPFTPGGYAQPYPPQQRPPSGPMPPNGAQWQQQYGPPPYQGSPQQFYPPPQNQRPPFPPRPDLITAENRQYNSPYNANQGPRPPMPLSASQTPKPHQMFPGTPINQGQPMRTTGSGTRWTFNALTTSSPALPFTIVPSPAFEPLSPPLQPSKLPTAKKSTKKVTQNPDVTKGKPGPKSGSTKKRGAQRTRAGSTASSVIAGSRRSMSIISHAEPPDELSLDVKEEVATPLPLGDEETGDTTADESTSLPPPRLPMSRSKRPTEITTSPTGGLKRKRADSVLGTPITPREPSAPPTHVLWTRNFSKISHSAIESVTSHRHAGMFSHPIKERDAPGYSNIILRPQDLKSIKAAINAGNRAAIEKEKSLGAEIPKIESSIWLPISEDLIPPKGIINYAQLEKELMRMFANAVMFNADPSRGFGDRLAGQKSKRGGEGYEFDEDGIVKEARDMQQDVEKTIGDLRSAEQIVAKGTMVRGSSMARGSSVVRGGSLARGSSVRGSSIAVTEDEIDELAGDGERVAGSVAKRRRKG